MQTLEGGLRVDVEDGGDWHLFGWIVRDAMSGAQPLSERLGGMITEEELAEDWTELVVPELEETFSGALSRVGAAIEAARLEAAGGAGSLWVKREAALDWYSALNQARLAIEEGYHFGPAEEIDPSGLPPDRQAVFLRAQFYCALQTLLLELVMN